MTKIASALNKDIYMERTDLERSSNSEPGGRCLSEPEIKAQAGIAVLSGVNSLAMAKLWAKEAVAGQE